MFYFGGFGNRRLIGVILLIVGIVIFVCCTPIWLWCSFIGIVLIVVGCYLLRGCF